MGLSLHNSIAVWQGFSGKKSAFIRTPKYNIKSKDDLFQKTSYLNTKMPLSTKLEFIVAFYFIGSIYLGFLFHNYVYIIIHFMLVFGFLSIASYSWKQTSEKNPKQLYYQSLGDENSIIFVLCLNCLYRILRRTI